MHRFNCLLARLAVGHAAAQQTKTVASAFNSHDSSTSPKCSEDFHGPRPEK